jgi:hypothetical protein
MAPVDELNGHAQDMRNQLVHPIQLEKPYYRGW